MRILLIITGVVLLNSCQGQTQTQTQAQAQAKAVVVKGVPDSISFINNDSIKYSIVLLACDTCVPISNIGYRVLINMPPKSIETVKTLGRDSWRLLLEDPKRDWAANLILYSIYQRDAWLLSRREDKAVWVEKMKAQDVKYWMAHLPK